MWAKHTNIGQESKKTGIDPELEFGDESSNALGDQSFKIIKDNDKTFLVPRESFIKKTLSEFTEKIKNFKENSLFIAGFSGVDSNNSDEQEQINNDDRQRIKNFDQLLNLDVFADDESRFNDVNITNGHYDSNERILMLGKKNESGYDLIGAVQFIIYLETQTLEIRSLAVSESEQKKGYGSALFQSAILIGSLYGVKTLCFQSTNAGLKLYLNHGLYLDNSESIYEELGNFVGKIKDIDTILKVKDDIELSLKVNDSDPSFSQFKEKIAEFAPDFNYPYYLNLHQTVMDKIQPYELKSVQEKDVESAINQLDLLKKQVKIQSKILKELEENFNLRTNNKKRLRDVNDNQCDEDIEQKIVKINERDKISIETMNQSNAGLFSFEINKTILESDRLNTNPDSSPHL